MIITVKPPGRSLCLLGGTGFVGHHLINQLIRAGFRVRVPTRHLQQHRDLLVFPGIELVTADIHNERALTRLTDGCEAVINLVGILNETGHDGSGFRHAHAELTGKLLNACQETGVGRLLHMSAVKANAERGPSHYLKTKGQAEQIIRSQSGDAINYTIFRPSTIFGPGDSFTMRFATLLRRLPVLPLPCPDARMAPVFIDDVTRAIMIALDDARAFNRVYELCGPQVCTLLDVVTSIKQWLGIHRAIVPLPKSLSRVQAWVGDYLLPGKPFSLDNFKSLSVAAVCTDDGFASLGITPTPMQSRVPAYLRRPTS